MLKKIAIILEGINKEDLTHAEKQIVKLLEDAGFVKYVQDEVKLVKRHDYNVHVKYRELGASYLGYTDLAHRHMVTTLSETAADVLIASGVLQKDQ